jgi:hypothetical protein
MPATTRLAQLMSTEEGFGKLNPDGTWTVPTRDNNPLDLRHSPHSSHAGEGPNDIGIIDTIEDGWADAERQLQIYAERGMTLQSMIAIFAPPNENNTSAYLEFVCNGLGMPPGTPVAQALTIPAA